MLPAEPAPPWMVSRPEKEWSERWVGVKVGVTPGGNIWIGARQCQEGRTEEIYRISGKSSVAKVQRHVRKVEKWIRKRNAKERRAGGTVREVRKTL